MAKYAINPTNQSNYIGIYEKALPNELTWQEKLHEAKTLGFNFIEISIDESEQRRARLDWSDDEIDYVNNMDYHCILCV